MTQWRQAAAAQQKDSPAAQATRHVYPLGDLIEHNVDYPFRSVRYVDGCVCGPKIETCPGGFLVTHHALDGREHYETDHQPHAGCPNPKLRLTHGSNGEDDPPDGYDRSRSPR